MFEVTKVPLEGEEITCIGAYRPWSHHTQLGGDGASYPTHSGRILDLKESKPGGIKYFADYLAPKLNVSEAIAVVPSHNANKGPGGLHALVSKLLETKCDIADASQTLVRHTTIPKLATGGDRNKNVHLDSIHVPDNSTVVGKRVLLLDDVLTSGNSMLACCEILLGAGAAKVVCLALGKTTY
jgi:predicted amidophosphoribosyltransferase